MNTLVGQLPTHQYVFVDSTFTHKKPVGLVPAIWFGLVSYPGRMWGCTVLLDSGAVYRNLPPHALAFSKTPEPMWTEQHAQSWDCYGRNFSCIEYDYLANVGDCRVKTRAGLYDGRYLFTAAPIGDGFSANVGQAKEFSFIELYNGRLTIQPTNHLLFVDRSFTGAGDPVFPTDLKRQDEVYSCESRP